MEQSINIKIADSVFPLKVSSPEQEEVIRKAAAEINAAIRHWLEKHPEKKLSEILSLVALKLCINNISLQKQLLAMNEEEGKLSKEIEAYLNEIDKNSR
ncbi:MAG: cell division protein ZapA [Bacteroidales bacterium]|nr:cell division protein ZapA [Bacteroidales bacterium]